MGSMLMASQIRPLFASLAAFVLGGCALHHEDLDPPELPNPWVATQDQQAYQRAFEAGYQAGQRAPDAVPPPGPSSESVAPSPPPTSIAPGSAESGPIASSEAAEPSKDLPQRAGYETLTSGERVTVVYYVHSEPEAI